MKNELSVVVGALTIEDSKKKEFHFPKIKSRRKELLDMAYKNLERDIESYFSKKDTIEKGIKQGQVRKDYKQFLCHLAHGIVNNNTYGTTFMPDRCKQSTEVKIGRAHV